jgi:hypothetical protein
LTGLLIQLERLKKGNISPEKDSKNKNTQVLSKVNTFSKNLM